MRIDYHMHLEYGSYELDWVRQFLEYAHRRDIDEIGIAEHSHGFIEFKELYYEDLKLDQSTIGRYQKQWLSRNKFRYTLKEYFQFMDMLKIAGYPVKTGIEICNFSNQQKVRAILEKYPFDYVIASVHFLKGYGYDFADNKYVWEQFDLNRIYEWYTSEIEALCAAKQYDILGHPFNLRMFKFLPQFTVQPFLERAASALKEADMAIDINTGTLYRYPIKEISPFPEFMEFACKYRLPVILSSDAHRPEDCGRYIELAEEYVKKYGYKEVLMFTKRQPMPTRLPE